MRRLFVRRTLLPLALCGMALVFGISRECSAHGIVAVYPLELSLGWVDMIIDGGGYRFDNHGFVATLSGGLSLLGMVGLHLDQDLGFAECRRTMVTDGGKKASEKLFRGATFLSIHAFFPLLDSDIFYEGRGYSFGPSFSLGLGAAYMQTPENGVQAWFAVRAVAGARFVWEPGVGVGAEVEYTLGASGPNAFDGKRVSHFPGAKITFVWMI